MLWPNELDINSECMFGRYTADEVGGDSAHSQFSSSTTNL